MGMLVNGSWFDDDPLPADRGGAFLRPDSSFRDRVSRDGSSEFQVERGRYQLVTAPSCPWAHRTVLMHALKRLEGAVLLLESDLPKGEGWAYSHGFDDLAPKNGGIDLVDMEDAVLRRSSRRRTASSMSTKSIPPPGPIIPGAPRCRCCGTARRRRSLTTSRPKSSAC